MSIKKWQLYITVICLISGAMVAWQYRWNASAQAESAQGRSNTLIGVIKDLEKETASLEEEIAASRKQLETVQKSQIGSSDQLASMQQELQVLNRYAGLTDATGPGITIILDDNVAGAEAAKNKPGYNPENFIIHDDNVRYIVNELKRAGAEAIAVNGQRIVTFSEIRCVGPVIFVNSTRMAPPYVIQAIGNPDRLEQAILNGEEFPYLKQKEFPVRLIKETNLKIPAYKGSYRLDHAQPIKEGGAKNEGRQKQE